MLPLQIDFGKIEIIPKEAKNIIFCNIDQLKIGIYLFVNYDSKRFLGFVKEIQMAETKINIMHTAAVV